MPEVKIVTSDMIQHPTTHDTIVNNELLQGVPDKTVYVQSSSELTNYINYPIGTYALQYGLTAMWQLKPDRTFVQVF